MKNVRHIMVNSNRSDNNIKDCKSIYHKKLTDSFKSFF